MIAIEKRFWLVHVYENKRYTRTIDELFTERNAEDFCRSFNAHITAKQAIAKEHTTMVETAKQLTR